MIRHILFEDFHLKAVAVLLSLILFFFVRGDRVSEGVSWVTVIYQLPESQVMVSESVKKLRVTLAGRQSKLKTVLRNGFDPVTIDLTHFTGGTYYFDEALLRLEPGIRLLSIVPAKMEVRMEPKIRKEVPVAPNVVGTPDPGYKLIQVAVMPRKVEVEGARSTLKKLAEVKTLPIDVENRSESTELDVGLSPLDGNIAYVDAASKVKVQLVFEARIEERIIPDLRVELVNSSWRASVSPATVRVRIEAPLRLVPKLEAAQFKAIVDGHELENKPPGSQHRLDVELENVPEHIRIVEIRPRKVMVRLQQKLPTEPEGKNDSGGAN